jgi:hypothetical protein
MNIFNEHKKRILESGYKYISLYRGSDRICAWNNLGKIDEKLNEIETRLNNNPPGIYVIKARNSVSEKAPDQFVIDNGGQPQPENKAGQPIVYKEPASEKLLENQRILDLTVKVAQLEMLNENLRKEISNLERELLEMEAAEIQLQQLNEPPAPSLMESAKDFLGSLMEFGAPLLDQHFSLQQQKLEIERMKYANRRPAPGTPQAAKDQNVQIRIIGEWVETYQDQPEIYEALHEISAKSENVSQFLTQLQQFNPELYAAISNKI